MKKFKKLLAGIMTLAMLVTMLPATVLADDQTITGENEPVTFNTDATVTLDNVKITAADGVSAISIEGNANVTLVLVGENTLTGGDNGAGIYVAEGASVTITGAGKLTATGNAGKDDESGAAGIGGTWANGNSGAITIDGAEVVAEGYGKRSSGIGSANGNVVGDIEIKNNANVTAYGGYYASGAGAKLTDEWGSGDPEGSAGIGGGNSDYIIITGSTVTAYGGSKAAGIGAKYHCSCKNISITNSTVTAYGGSSSAGIGTSRASSSGAYANITISGGKVTAVGGEYGAGIGSGYNNKGNDNNTSTISISGAKIIATGGMGSAGIGGGYKAGNVKIDISSSDITAEAGPLVNEDYLYMDWGDVTDRYNDFDRTACAIGAGADGDSNDSFETKETKVTIDMNNTTVSVTAYEGGKKAIEGIENEALGDAYTEEKMPRKGSNSYAYTKEVDGYVRVWGEGGGNAKESFVLKLYSKDELIATTKLNNVGGIIDGDVYVTWNFFYPESNDEYWTTTWEAGHPQSAAQPTKVKLYIDGQMVAETAAKMSGADDVNTVVWRELGGVAKTDLVPDVNGEFIIKDLTDLKAFRAMVNSGNTFKGKTVKLDADIDLNNEEWTPIGTSSNKFCGTFNGQNHTISNLRINGGYYQGLFGVANGGSKFMNLTIHNVDIDAKGWVGSLLGRAESGGTIDNVKLTGKVTIDAYYYVGGIVGRNYYGDLTNITVDTEEGSYIYANSVENGTAYRTYVGGVVGWKGEGNNIVRNVTSDIDVTGSTIDVGGIAGIAHYGNSFINVSCSGDVTTLADNVEDACETGGIAGVWNNNGSNITFENLEYTGKLSAPNVEEDFAFPNSGLVGAPYSKTGTGTIVGDIAAVGNQTYKTLAAAMSDAGENDIIYLLGDAGISGEGQIVIGKQNKYAFDLGGNELKCDGFLNKGTLNIMNGTLVCADSSKSAIESTGTLNVTDVDVTAARHAIRVEGGTAVVDGGTYKVSEAWITHHAVNVSDDATVTIKDGTFYGAKGTGSESGTAVNCRDTATVTIEGGHFSHGMNNTLAGTGIVVKGGYFDQDPAAYVAEGYKVKDNDDATYLYKVTGYSTNIGHGFQTIISDDREATTTTLEDVYAKDSLVVKIYSGNTLLGTTTLKAVDDEGNPMYPATGEYTVNNVINGRESGSWDTVWNVELTRKNVPTKIEVYADGKLTDTYTGADGCFLDEENKTAYVGLFPEIVDVPSSPSGNGGGSTSKKYSVEIDEDIENGSIKLDRTKAKSGTEVTITATPDKGYKLDELKVLNSRGTEIDLEDNGDGTFTFKMPKGGVDIEASFVEGEAESEAPAGEKESLVLTINQVIYQMNGSYAANDVAPIIKGDRTMLPIRLIAEFLGATVTWNETEQSVTIVKDDMTIVIYIGQAFALVNGEPVQLDAPAFIANDRTYLPLRFVAENLGAVVTWDGLARTVTIVAE